MHDQIQAVIFDMDGLLLDTERVYFDSYRATRADHALPPDDDLFMQLIGLPLQDSMNILAAGLGHHIDVSVFDAAWGKRCKAILQHHIPVKPGVVQALTHLKDRAIPYAIATSTKTLRAREHLDKAGIGHHFEILIGGDQVQTGKPAPDIYLKTAATLGIDPSRCAAFEDSENGVRAAVAAGMITTQIPDLKPPSDTIRALGHRISPNLLDGFHRLGLCIKSET